MKIALAQINTTVGDFEGNLSLILEGISLVGQRNVDLIVFPEMTLTGYPPKDLLDRPDFVEKNLKTLRKLAKKVGKTAVIVGFVEKRSSQKGKSLANSAAFLHRGKIVEVIRKRLLPTYDVFDEGRYFEPGPESRLIDFKGKRIGLSICEDIWTDQSYWGKRPYPIDPIAEQARLGADILINISASPYSLGKHRERHRILGKQARKHGVPLIYVNLVGGNDDLVFDGGSMAWNGKGEVVQALPYFKSSQGILNLSRMKKIKIPQLKEEDLVLDALVLGLRDYLRKCGFEKLVIGLSGGIDSALTAWIAAQAIAPKDILGVSMPSPFSSPGSLRDAQALAKSLGIQFRVLPIGDLYGAFQETLGFQKSKKIDIALQNLQARIRGNLLMALSNREGRLLVTTGNKSEVSLGYCTLYGDMAGGFSVLVDVPKTWVYRLARLANRRKKAIPNASLIKAPSAELAPNQRDEDDLPPYKIIDQILEAYIVKRMSPKEIVTKGFSKIIVEDILRRLDQNEYKRMQTPPGIRITNKAFGYGRRVPIANRYRVKL